MKSEWILLVATLPFIFVGIAAMLSGIRDSYYILIPVVLCVFQLTRPTILGWGVLFLMYALFSGTYFIALVIFSVEPRAQSEGMWAFLIASSISLFVAVFLYRGKPDLSICNSSNESDNKQST